MPTANISRKKKAIAPQGPLPVIKRKAQAINRALHKLYPEAKMGLEVEGGDPLKILVATILSAQCTDEQVNKITPALFESFPDAPSFAKARQPAVEKLIRSTGLFRNKAKNIIACCNRLVTEHDGEVPAKLEALVKLPGIGRKTANCVLGNAFNIPGITVDTHVGRLARRWGVTAQRDPTKVEKELMVVIPKKQWTSFSHATIWHGRKICPARKPLCDRCALIKWCDRVGVKDV